MSEENGDAATPDNTEPKKTKGKSKKTKSTKRANSKILLIAVGAFFFIGGGGLGAYFGGFIHSALGLQQGNTVAELQLGQPVVHELPEIRTDMKTGACRSPFLRAVVQVQLAPEFVDRLEETQAQVMDGILTHLRAQERHHVVGKEGSERLRFELVQIIDNNIRPARVQTIFFKELIVQ